MTESRARKVLVIDDDRGAADALCALFGVLGHPASLACSAAEGLAAARDQRPDVIFLDIALPDMDGFAVANALRAQPENRRVLLVALTGHGQASDITDALARGFDHHILKPAKLEELELIMTIPL